MMVPTGVVLVVLLLVIFLVWKVFALSHIVRKLKDIIYRLEGVDRTKKSYEAEEAGHGGSEGES